MGRAPGWTISIIFMTSFHSIRNLWSKIIIPLLDEAIGIYSLTHVSHNP